jgi:SAM-dependent methyltransferase
MVDYTDGEYHRKRRPELLENRTLRLAWAHFADAAYFQGVAAGQRVLEFGGGVGNNLLVVKNRAEVVMLEPSPLARGIAAKEGIRVVSKLDDLSGMRFDLVLCRHVLEHLDNPLETLRALRGLLSAIGRLIVVLPCERCDSMPREVELDHHLYCWNPRTLANLLARASYEVEAVRFEYYGARRKMLPVYESFGGRAYATCLRCVGRALRLRELVVVSRPYEVMSV